MSKAGLQVGDRVAWGDYPSEFRKGVIIDVYSNSYYGGREMAAVEYGNGLKTSLWLEDLRPYDGSDPCEVELPSGANWVYPDGVLSRALSHEITVKDPYDESQLPENVAKEVDGWWACVATYNRDSGHLQRHNYDEIKSELWAKQPDDPERHGFAVAEVCCSHWAVGFVYYLCVDVRGPAWGPARRLLTELETYPVLDEDKLSETLWDLRREEWMSYAKDAFVQGLNGTFGTPEDEWPADEYSDEQIWRIWELATVDDDCEVLDYDEGWSFEVAEACRIASEKWDTLPRFVGDTLELQRENKE